MAYSLKMISGFVDVPPDTVRKWEMRYGVVSPVRLENGYREYSEEDLSRLRIFMKLRGQGLSAGKAARKALEEAPSVSGGDAGVQERIYRAAVSFDRNALVGEYEAAESMGVLEAFRRIWFPVLIRLGREADGNKGIGIAAEHMTTGFLREKILGSFGARSSGERPAMIMAGPEGDQHELGMLFAMCVLESKGVRCLYLGANLPLESLIRVVERTGAGAASLTLTNPVRRKELKAMLAEFKNRCPAAELFVAGSASLKHANLIKQSGAAFIGTDLDGGIDRIVETVGGGG